MKKVGNTRVLVCILGFLSLLYAQQRPSVNSPSCVQTAPTRIYSNAFAHEETGDILGYELAIKENKDSAADILLYVYEGAPDDEGIPLSGRLSGKRLIAQGKWVEHLVQYPEKTEVVQTRSVKVEGTLDTASFNGQIRIESMESADRVRLKRVKKLWFCKR